MPSFTRLIYSPRAFDSIFAITGIACVIMLWFGADKVVPAIEPPSEPWRKGMALLAILFAGGAIATVTTRLDQKLADDFVYQVLARSAFVAMFVLVFSVVLWEVLFASNLGGLSGFSVFCLALGGWSLAYFYTRWRGTGA